MIFNQGISKIENSRDSQLGISNLRVILSFITEVTSSLLLVLISLMIGLMKILGFMG